jgi:hypothetical protein
VRLPHLAPGHHDVEVSSSLLGGTTVEAIPAGEVIQIICGFVNNGDTMLNISGIMGSLNDPADFAQYMHNFSGLAVGEPVEAGGEMSLAYPIPVPRFPDYPFTLQMAITVFYEDDSEYYSTTFFNETVTFHEPKEEIKVDTVLPYALGLATLAVAVLLFPDSHPAIERAKICTWRNRLLGGAADAGGKKRRGGASSGASRDEDDGDRFVPSVAVGSAKKKQK